MSHITHTANGRRFLIVEVPKEAETFDTHLNNLIWKTFDTPHAGHNIELPPATYRILFIAEQATPEQASEVVGEVMYDLPPSPSNDFQGDWDYAYIDYDTSKYTDDELMSVMAEHPYVRTSIESIQSLIRANFPDENFNHLILEIC